MHGSELGMAERGESISCGMRADRGIVVWLQGQQGASLQLTARLQAELTSFNPTLAINNGDIAYARHVPTYRPSLHKCAETYHMQDRSIFQMLCCFCTLLL